jgi:hypothetical protein
MGLFAFGQALLTRVQSVAQLCPLGVKFFNEAFELLGVFVAFVD